MAIVPECHVDSILITARSHERFRVRRADPLPVKQRCHIRHKLVKSESGQDRKCEKIRFMSETQWIEPSDTCSSLQASFWAASADHGPTQSTKAHVQGVNIRHNSVREKINAQVR